MKQREPDFLVLEYITITSRAPGIRAVPPPLTPITIRSTALG